MGTRRQKMGKVMPYNSRGPNAEEELKEALYALNRSLWKLDNEDSTEYHAVTKIRDNLFDIGQRAYGWKD